MEIGDSGISMVWMNANKNFLLGAIVYSFSENEDAVVSLENIFHSRNIFNNKPATVTICYNYKESLLVPEKYSTNGNSSEMLSLVFGGREETIVKNDKAPASEITTIYRIPETVNKLLNKYFPQAIIRHSSTFQLESTKTDSLKAILFYDTVKIILHRKGKVEKIIFADIKTGEAKLNKTQKQIRDAVSNKKVNFKLY